MFTQTNKAARFQYSDSSCGIQGGHKILVAYASEFGTTREVAEVIGQVLCQAGATVEIKWVNNVKDLNAYAAVIIGSAIQYDKWMPEARKFVSSNQNRLSKLPVAFFFTCLTLSIQTAKTERQALAYADKLHALLPQTNLLSVGRFAGVLDYSKLPFLFRLISRIIFSIIGVQEGDYRDWATIRSWAEDVHSELSRRIAEMAD